MWAGIVGALGALFSVITAIIGWLKKTPEEKERDRIKEERERRQDSVSDNNAASRRADETRGDTSDLEDRFKR